MLEARVKYNRGDINSTLKAASRLSASSRRPVFVTSTAYGYTIADKPAPFQSYYEVQNGVVTLYEYDPQRTGGKAYTKVKSARIQEDRVMKVDKMMPERVKYGTRSTRMSRLTEEQFFSLPSEARNTGRPAKQPSSKTALLHDLTSGNYSHLVISTGNRLRRPNFRSLRDRRAALRYRRVHQISPGILQRVAHWSRQTKYGECRKYADGTVAHQVWHYHPDLQGCSNVANWYVLYPDWMDEAGVITRGKDGQRYRLVPVPEQVEARLKPFRRPVPAAQGPRMETTTTADIAHPPHGTWGPPIQTGHHVRICPHCGRKVDLEYKQCPRCGTKLTEGLIIAGIMPDKEAQLAALSAYPDTYAAHLHRLHTWGSLQLSAQVLRKVLDVLGLPAEQQEWVTCRDSRYKLVPLAEAKGAEAPVGSGERFAALVKSIGQRGKVRDPAAVAAAIGRRKYGKKKFQQMAAAGRRRKGSK